jgi:Trk K+ transport system NAD-binding subunit
MASVVVCGLGTLGQYCARKLKDFGATVTGVDLSPNCRWELPDAAQSIDRLVVGDCREPSILQEAGIARARAILIVAAEERVNIAAAFAARSLNPSIRIVIRSGQERLNELLGAHLDDFVAFEPTQMAAPAFALESLGEEILGLFTLKERPVRITRHIIDEHSRWCGLPLAQLDTHQTRVLTTATAPASEGFSAWEPDAILRAGDRLTYLELDRGLERTEDAPAAKRIKEKTHLDPGAWGQAIADTLWTHASQTQRIAGISLVALFALYLLGVALYMQQYPAITLHDALNVSVVLILGGYDNLFGSLQLPFPIPPYLHIFSILETIAGTVFIGIVYAFLTERVLSARFQFRQKRPGVPRSDHVIIVGLGKVGTAVATLLRELKIPVVACDRNDTTAAALPDLPFVHASGTAALEDMNVSAALSVMALTSDEVANLELALVARARNERCALVIRTDEPRFSENVSRLVPRAHALGVHDLAAEAFAAAAFGESILGLVRIDGQTTLLTEYRIEPDDSLADQIMAELIYGYGILPLLHETGGVSEFLPSDEGRLKAGDRLVVLATIDGLQRVEQRTPRSRQWTMHLERALTDAAAFSGAMTIARSTQCGIEAARAAMESLPCTFPYPLYKQQAQRLVRKLARVQVEARVQPRAPGTEA